MKYRVWKIIYLVVLISTTVVVVGFSSIVRMRGLVNNVFQTHFSISNWVPVISTEPSVEAVLPFDSFQSIRVDAAIADFELKQGDNYQVTLRYPEKLMPTVEVKKDGTLTITQKTGISTLPNFSTPNYKLVIEVPADATLDMVEVKVDAGSLALTHVSPKTVDVTLAAGNVKLTSVQADHLTVNCNAGDTALESCEAAVVDFDLDMGDLRVKECSFTEAVVSLDMGKVDWKNTDFETMKAAVSMGDLEIQGTFQSLVASVDMGDIRVKTDETNGCHMDLEVSMGGIQLNGSSKGKSYNQ